MKEELILKREDGETVKIVAVFSEHYSRYNFYKIHVYYKAKGKRNWINTVNTDDFSYRRIEMHERPDYENQQNLKKVTEVEIHDAKLKAWRSMQPVFTNTKEAMKNKKEIISHPTTRDQKAQMIKEAEKKILGPTIEDAIEIGFVKGVSFRQPWTKHKTLITVVSGEIKKEKDGMLSMDGWIIHYNDEWADIQ